MEKVKFSIFDFGILCQYILSMMEISVNKIRNSSSIGCRSKIENPKSKMAQGSINLKY